MSMTNEQKEIIYRLERYLIANKINLYITVWTDDLDTALSLIKEQQEEIEKKDKQIDLMAEYISKRDVEEDICMKNKTNPDWCNEDYTNCQGCIKKYFAGLVEKE